MGVSTWINIRNERFARWKTPRRTAKQFRVIFDTGPKTPARPAPTLLLVIPERGGRMLLRRMRRALGGTAAVALLLPAAASADTSDAFSNGVLPQSVAINSIWVLV